MPAATLWVYVDDPENNIRAVEAVVVPPGLSFEEADIVSMVENEAAANRWEGVYDKFVSMLQERKLVVQCGQFAADMRVVVDNDGPVTILVDSKKVF